MTGATKKPVGAPAAKAGCPICGAPRQAAYRPFCSRRCADVDLNRWLTGGYSVPGPPAERGEEEEAED